MTNSTRIVLVPGTPALLPVYASIEDPIPGLRAAVRAAASWLVALGDPVMVQCEPRAARIAECLISAAGGTLSGLDKLDQQTPLDQPTPLDRQTRAILVIGNGSACRTEKAPGFFDARAEAFDTSLGDALRRPDPAVLTTMDQTLSKELLADTAGIAWLGSALIGEDRTVMTYDDDPFGVQYWVAQWEFTR